MAGVARQRAGPTSLGIAPRACTILNKLFLLLLLPPRIRGTDDNCTYETVNCSLFTLQKIMVHSLRCVNQLALSLAYLRLSQSCCRVLLQLLRRRRAIEQSSPLWGRNARIPKLASANLAIQLAPRHHATAAQEGCIGSERWHRFSSLCERLHKLTAPTAKSALVMTSRCTSHSDAAAFCIG